MGFAKIFETERGQIMVMRDINDDNSPCVRVYSEPDGFGVCSIDLKFKDDEDGWSKMEIAFNDLTEDVALLIANDIFDLAEWKCAHVK